MRVSLLNRKLYIVSGDMRLLQFYCNKDNIEMLERAENDASNDDFGTESATAGEENEQKVNNDLQMIVEEVPSDDDQ